MNALVVIDGSVASQQGLGRAAQSLLAGQDGTVLLLHIIPASPVYGKGLPVWDEWDDLAAEYARSRGLLEQAARRLREQGVRCPVKTESVVGDPRGQFLRAAMESGADLIIPTVPLHDMERRGEPGLSHNAALVTRQKPLVSVSGAPR